MLKELHQFHLVKIPCSLAQRFANFCQVSLLQQFALVATGNKPRNGNLPWVPCVGDAMYQRPTEEFLQVGEAFIYRYKDEHCCELEETLGGSLIVILQACFKFLLHICNSLLQELSVRVDSR